MCDYLLPAWKSKQLKKFHKTLKRKHEADRIKAIVLLGTGYAPSQVAEILLISEGSERSGRKNYTRGLLKTFCR